MAPSDSELVTRIKTGDMDALGQVVERHKDPLVNYLICLTRCRDRAEDVAQETFLRFYRASSSYSERGQLAAFLFRIATNLLRSEERRARRWRILSGSLTSDNGSPVSGPTPQGELLSEEATGKVNEALANLPLRYRVPLVLREIEGWSYRDIAAALECREGTIKSRISRGKLKLRHLLESYWNGDG